MTKEEADKVAKQVGDLINLFVQHAHEYEEECKRLPYEPSHFQSFVTGARWAFTYLNAITTSEVTS